MQDNNLAYLLSFVCPNKTLVDTGLIILPVTMDKQPAATEAEQETETETTWGIPCTWARQYVDNTWGKTRSHN